MKTEFQRDNTRKENGESTGMSVMRDGSKFMLEMDNWVKWKEHLMQHFRTSNDVYGLLSTGIMPVFDLPELVTPIVNANGMQAADAEGNLRWARTPEFNRPDGELLYRERRKEVSDNSYRFHKVDLPRLMMILSVHIGTAVHNKITAMPEYNDRYRDGDAVWMLQSLEFVATGRGAHTIHMSAVNILKMKPTGYDQGPVFAYFKEYMEECSRLMACGTEGEILRAVLDSAFIMSMRGSPMLAKEMDEIWKSDRWPTREDCIDSWTKIYTVKGALPALEDETGKLIAHTANMSINDRISWVEGTQNSIADMQRQLARASHEDPVAYAAATAGTMASRKKSMTMQKKQNERLCFNCMSKEHLYADCPLAKTTCAICQRQHHTKVHDAVEKLKGDQQRKRDGLKKGKKPGGFQHQSYVSDEVEEDEHTDPLMEGYNSMVGYHTLKRVEAHKANTVEFDDEDDQASDLEQNIFGNVASVDQGEDFGWLEAYAAGKKQGWRSRSGNTARGNGRKKTGPFNLDSDSDNE